MDGPYHMELDETFVHPPRKVSVALRDRLKEELDKLVREKVINPVTEPTNWVSSLVLVNKPEKLRICIDPQDLNKALLRAHYPLPTIEDVATRLCKTKVFGHVLTPDGLKPDQSKVKAIVAMPTPSDNKALERLLGMIGYLAKFLPNQCRM